VSCHIPSAVAPGRYHSKGFHVRRQRQYVRATGLPEPSTWASAARSSGVMTEVEYRRNSSPYCPQVSGGALVRTPLTGKNSSVGLRITWYAQFTASHSATAAPAPTA